MSATITWVDVAEEVPDADQTVLLHLEDGEVWTGFLDGETWRFVTADKIETPVMHWAAFPEPPAL